MERVRSLSKQLKHAFRTRRKTLWRVSEAALRLLATLALVLTSLPLSVMLPPGSFATPKAAEAAPGDLDATFGTGGKVTSDFSGAEDVANALALQADGKVVVAGSAVVSSEANFAVARYTAGGTLDTTFNFNGKVTTRLGYGNQHAYALALQADGKIVVAGHAWTGSQTGFGLARYCPNGSLDGGGCGSPAFGQGTLTTAAGGSDDTARAIAIQGDGKIVAVGDALISTNNRDWALIRFNADGSLDTTFNGTGKVITAIGPGIDYGFSVGLQGDGKIAVAGASHNGTNYDFALARYDTNGSLDTAFGTSGIVKTAIGAGDDVGYALKLQADGKILVAGYSHNGTNNDFAVVRHNANGSLDASFGTGGKVTTAIGSGDDLAKAVSLQTDGKIILTGMSSNGTNNDFALARYNANGSLDTSFGSGGKVTTPIGAGADEAWGAALQGDGKIVVAGKSFNGTNDDFALARYQTASNNADLSGLALSAGTLTPAFAAATTSYTASVANGVSSITATPSAADSTATIQVRVNGGAFSAVPSGSASGALALNVGANPIDVKVTAQDGTTVKTYTITVNRAAPAFFTVTSTADIVDANPGDGVCHTGVVGAECTLRAAIQETNALPGADTITLAAGTYTLTIPGAGEDNAATGDLDIKDSLTITGASAATTIVEGHATSADSATDRVFHIVGNTGTPTVNISGVTIRNGKSPGGTHAGGIYNAAGTLNLTNVTVSGNKTLDYGAGIRNDNGTVKIMNSTVSGNAAASLNVGGIYNFNGTLTITNSSVSGNSAGTNIGGIANDGGTLTIVSSTITGNTASGNTGGIYGPVTMKNTILAGNTAATASPDCQSTITSQGYNLVGNISGCAVTGGSGDQVGTATSPINPMLGPLADNGGPTKTHALLAGSPAIDAGNPSGCVAADGTTALTTDQRGAGFPRSLDGNGDGTARCDIGAYELVPAAETTPPSFVYHFPSFGATSVAPGAMAGIGFSEAMNHTATEGAFCLFAAGGSCATKVGGAFTWVTPTGSLLDELRFQPTNPLAVGSYTVTISPAATDLAGNPLSNPNTTSLFDFTVASPGDTTAPTVSSLSPANGATGVATSTAVTLTWSEAMGQSSTRTAFCLYASGGSCANGVASNFSGGGTTLTFTPSAALAAGTAYTVEVRTLARDVNGNALASPFSSTFTTVGAPAKLAFTTQPGGATAGAAFTTQPVVTIQDASGNTVTTATNAVTLAITGGTGTANAVLSGCTPTNTNGVVSFSGCKIDLAGTGYTLTATATGLTSALSAAFNVLAPVLSDNFDDNAIDPALWTTFQAGSGPTVAEANQRLEIALPATSANDPTKTANMISLVFHAVPFFGAGYTSVCQLRGDFDIQVDYSLLVWPPTNGVRVGLATAVGATERTSFGSSTSDFPGQPREIYFTDFAGGVQGITATTDLAGKLRQVRSGTTVTGYYFSSGNWVAISTGSATTADTPFKLMSWSHDYAFAHQSGQVAFDNFIVNQGQVICPAATKLAFTSQPAGATAGAAFTTQPVVTIQDASGSTVTTATNAVILSITANTGTANAVLSGCSPTNTSGVVSFSGCKIDLAGTGYTLAATATALTSAVSSAFNVGPGQGYRYVKVQLRGTNYLSLAEVQVFQGSTNLALSKPATQSSINFGGEAGRAVDGNTDGNFFAGSVSHTYADPQAWWQVDLQGLYAIDHIVLWNRTDCCPDRLSNFDVLVSADGVTWINVAYIPGTAPATLDLPVAGAACVLPPSGLVSWWPGDGNASDIQDGNPGALMNGATFAAGKVGQAFSFDGVDDDVLIGVAANLNVGSGEGLTIDAWIFPKGPTASLPAATIGSGPIVEYKNGVHIWQHLAAGAGDPLGGLFVNLVDTNAGTHFFQVPAAVVQNTWNHIAVTYSKASGAAILYSNGNAVGSQAVGTFTPKTSTDLHIGRRSVDSFPDGAGGYSFNGLIDEAGIFSRALTAPEIQSIYNAGSAGKCKPVVSAPTKLAIPQISPASPTAGQAFSVTVQAQDNSGNPANVTQTTPFFFSVKTGTGTLGGNTTGTIAAGTNSATISGVTYSKADSGVVLTAIRTSGDALAAGDSAPFDVVAFRPGDLDPTFGVGGKVTTALGAGDDWAKAVVFQADGKIVAAGTLEVSATYWVFALARYNADGSLDTAFGTGGKVTTDFGGSTPPAAGLATQADGRIILAGLSVGVSGNHGFGLARYNTDGSLDTTFGRGGKVTPPDTVLGTPWAVALQPDGKIVVAGQSPAQHFLVARYHPNGTLDTTFGTGGAIATDFGTFAEALALQPDGKIVVAGAIGKGGVDFDFALARFNPDGTLDSTFGTGGKVTTDFTPGNDLARALALQADGKLVAAGYVSGDFALARYNPNGSLDTTFGTGGKVITDVSGVDPATAGVDEARAVALQPDGKIIAVGYAGGTNPFNFAVVRYYPDGTLDTTYGTGGKVVTDFSASDDRAFAAALQADKLVAAGWFRPDGNAKADFALARYLLAVPPPPGGGGGGAPTPIAITLGPTSAVVQAGNIFTVDLKVDAGAGSVDAVDAFLDFNSAKLKVVDAAGNPVTAIAANPSSPLPVVLQNTVDNAAGRINFSAGRQTSGTPATGAFTLATVRFKAVAPSPGAALKFSTAVPRKTDAFSGGQSVGLAGPGGTIGIKGVSLGLSPITTTAAIGGTFTLDITADAGPQVVDAIDVFLNYDRAKLQVVDGSGNPATSITANTASPLGVVLQNSVDSTNGQISFSAGKQTAQSPVSGAFTLATVRFKAVGPSPGSAVAFNRESPRTTGAFFQGGSVLGPFIAAAPPAPGLDLDQDRSPLAGARIAIAGVRLFIDPATTLAGLGGVVTLSLKADAGTQQVDEIDAFLNFDPAKLRVVDAAGHEVAAIEPNSASPLKQTLRNIVDNAAGRIDLSAGRLTADPPATGTFTLATIRFKAMAEAPAPGTLISFATAAPRQTAAFFLGNPVTGPLQPGSVAISVGPVLVLQPNRGPAGTPVTASGQGFTSGDAVELRLDGATGALLATATAGTGGTFTTPFTIPAGTSVGAHSIKAVVAGTIVTAAAFTVTVLIELAPQTATVAVGGAVDVAIRAHSGAQLLDGVEAFLTFNPALLEVVDADTTKTGVQLSLGDCALPSTIENQADNTSGTLHLARGRGTDTASPPISGSCTLGTIKFRGKAEGTAAITFALPPAFPATKIALAGEALPISVGNGVVHVVGRPLVFTSQPVKGAHGFAFGIQPVVGMQEGGAPVAIPDGTMVTLKIKANTGAPGATLTCAANPVAAVNGLATFAGCTIDLKGDGYVLEASAQGAGPGATQPFNVIWAGDANGDCLVDIVDFSVLVHSFGKRVGDAGYDPRADVNGDNVVDILDFSVFVTLFGTRCPSLALAPTTGPAGTVVTVTGNAYVANREVSLTFDGLAVTTTPATVTSNGSGGFTASLTVPTGTAAGTHVVKASQVNGRVIAGAVFTVP